MAGETELRDQTGIQAQLVLRSFGDRARELIRCVAALCIFSGTAIADDHTQGKGLEYAGTFYLWGSGLTGTQSIFGLPATEVDLRFGDILDKVDMAAAGIFEVRGEKTGMLAEINYVKLGASAETPNGLLRGDLSSKAFFALAAGTWEISSSEKDRVDLIAGLKYFRFDNDLGLNPGALSASDTASWTDAIIGVKASFEFAPKWSLKTWAMVGAGGSDLTWDVLAAVDYSFADNWSASFGYRAMGVDYASDSFSYDMRQYGPIFGLTRRF